MWKFTKSQARCIIKAIDRYILKAEEDEEEELREIGYLEAAATVAIISSLEEQFAEAIENQSKRFCSALSEFDNVEEFLNEGFEEFVQNDTIQEEIREILEETSKDILGEFTTSYLNESGLELAGYTDRTIGYVARWVEDTSEYFSENTVDQLRRILAEAINEGKGVDKLAREIQAEGIRNTYHTARRVAQTEVLRMHSYAAFEAMIQNPDLKTKSWVHTGAHKNRPRPNHVAMDGTTIPKMERFTLYGADGCIYHPMFPRDSCLPASETVNCKCIIRRGRASPVTFDTEEKKKKQQEAIEADNKRWIEEQGKEPETSTKGMLEWVKSLDKEQQQEYFGGGDAGLQRWALIESGVIDTDDKFQVLYKTNEKGIRSRKSLKELADDGIMTVPKKTLNHSALGDYKAASKKWPSGRLVSGGHSQAAIQQCDSLGVEYQITETLANGVRIGNVPSSKSKMKRNDNGQTWFPEDWNEDDILLAGIYVANTAPVTDNGYIQTGRYKGVVIRVLGDNNGPATIYPYFDQGE